MSDESAADSYTFQVDLRGLVDLLSSHLYSSPRVYVRELLQNAVDATTARGQLAGSGGSAVSPGSTGIRITAGPDGLEIVDHGIGLTEEEAHRFLSTIGRSSKRDDLEGARREFLGQFGIGLLACFTVAEEITVLTRSAKDPAAKTVEWRATSDGRYGVRVLPGPAGDSDNSNKRRVPGVSDGADNSNKREAPGTGAPGTGAPGTGAPGTTVRLTPRRGAERWFDPGTVADLARDYGAFLPCEVTVNGTGTTQSPAVWDRRYASDRERRAALLDYARENLGFAPLDVIDLEVPLAGVRGAGFVLPRAASPADGSRHRVYLKGMLLSDAASGLLPEWAFFVRCVIDTDTLRPTASREALYEDETLLSVRENLGGQVRDWLTRLAAEDPARLAAFLGVHDLGVKDLARYDRELLRIMLPHLRFETTDGEATLAEFARAHPRLYLAPTVEEFRQVEAIASAQGIGVINGGYTYVSELVLQLPELLPGTTVETLDADVISAALDPVRPEDELKLAGFLGRAREILDPLGCDVILRAFHPVSVPALFLDSRAARTERTRAEIAAEADDLWSEILGSLKSTTARAQLALNHHNPVIRRLAGLAGQPLLTAAVESLYGQALLMTHRPLRPTDSALLNRAFGELLRHATRSAADHGAADHGAAEDGAQP